MTIGMLLLAASTTWAQKMWTMDDCIDYALQHSAKVMKSRVEADNARQDQGAAMAGFMPTVAGSGGSIELITSDTTATLFRLKL